MNVFETLVNIIGLWALIDPKSFEKSVEPVRKAFQSIKNNFQNRLNFGLPQKTEFKQPLLSSNSEKIITAPIKKTNKLYVILAGLVIISIVLAIIPTINIPSPTFPSEQPVPSINYRASGGMNIINLFWMYVFLFGIIGGIRGWAKEILVIFSILVALALNSFILRYFSFLRDLPVTSSSLFWIRSIIIFGSAYFGYQMVVIIPRFIHKSYEERLQDSIFGTVIGGINGYLVVGTILAYFHKAEYPYPNIIAPATDIVFLDKINTLMAVMPPNFLGEPGIYFAVAIMIFFIFVVYISGA